MTSSEHAEVDEPALRAQARTLWIEDRARLVFHSPHLATLAMHLLIVPIVDERLPTAATDGVSIFVNPYWIHKLDAATRVFVLAHEVWHNALLHFHRRGSREPRRWNVATDHEVNQLLARDGMKLPDDCVNFPAWPDASAEEVYARLGEEASHDRGPDADVHLDDEEAGESERGQKCASRLTDPARFGPIRGRRDSGWTPVVRGEATDAWRTRIVVHREALWGLLPNEVRSTVEAVVRPTLPWPALLADFVTRASGGRFQWHPPSRRHAHRGLFLPSRRDELLRIAVAVDTSASTEEAWPAFASELRRIVQSFGRYELRLLQCDAEVQADEVYEPSRPLPTNLPLRGGGGTDFEPVFACLAGSSPTALVYLTDGYGIAPPEPPPYPVLWVLTPGGTAPVGWGRRVALGRG